MRKKPGINLLFVLVFIIPLSAWALVSWYEKNQQALPVLGKKGHHIGNYELKDQDGQLKSSNAWKDKIVVANFFFTHCPVVCPAMMKNLLRVQKKYPDKKDLLFTSFTVDPERDTVERLKQFSLQYKINSNNWDLLTGSKKEIYMLARNSFMVVATDGDGGPTDFIHSEKLVLIDKQKRIRGYYTGTNDEEADQLIRDIKKLEHEK